MYFLELNIGSILISALLGMLFSLLVLSVIILVLHKAGVQLFRRKGIRAKSRTKDSETEDNHRTSLYGELPEEELLVILTAAAMEALEADDKGRFRVVAFRRI